MCRHLDSDRNIWPLVVVDYISAVLYQLCLTLFISEQITSYTPDTIFLQDGHTHTLVDLSSLNNSYCVVAQPFSESSLVPGHCHVTLDRTTRAVQGRWSVLLGIPGRVTELHVDTTVAVEGEFALLSSVKNGNLIPSPSHTLTLPLLSVCHIQQIFAENFVHIWFFLT